MFVRIRHGISISFGSTRVEFLFVRLYLRCENFPLIFSRAKRLGKLHGFDIYSYTKWKIIFETSFTALAHRTKCRRSKCRNRRIYAKSFRIVFWAVEICGWNVSKKGPRRGRGGGSRRWGTFLLWWREYDFAALEADIIGGHCVAISVYFANIKGRTRKLLSAVSGDDGVRIRSSGRLFVKYCWPAGWELRTRVMLETWAFAGRANCLVKLISI